MMETRLLARLLAAARTVTPLEAAGASRGLVDERSEPLRGQVAARLADGTFRVLIDGRSYQLSLPANVKPGDRIELAVVNRDAGPNADAAPMRNVPADALSSTGRLISALLSAVTAAPLRQAKPILDVPPATPADLSEPLARAVERSGMFYESHQARWLDGDYPLERLLQEPQAALASARSRRVAEDVAEARELHPHAPALPALPAAEEDGQAIGEAGASALPRPSSLRDEEAQQSIVARDALPFVRQQLDVLDGRHLTWLGDLWPGQTVRWEIEADASDRGPEDGQAGWSTRFSLVLPLLGEVGAEMAIGGLGLRLGLQAHTPQAAALMRSAVPELAQALASAGVKPVHVEVHYDEPAA